MGGRILHLRAIGRAAFVVAIAAALVVAAAHFRNTSCELVERVHASVAAQLARDPLSLTLAQCAAMGAKDSALCEAAWAENRRRFFTGHPSLSIQPGPHEAPLHSGAGR